MSEFQQMLSDRSFLLTTSVFFSVFNSWVAFKKGFFRYPFKEKSLEFNVTLGILVGAFVVFLAIQVVFIPAIFGAYFYFKTGEWADFSKVRLDTHMMGWLNVFSMVTSSLGVIIYSSFLAPQLRRVIWERGERHRPSWHIRSLLFGALTWLISYPIVMVLVQVFSLFLNWIFQVPDVDQVAVKALKMTLEFPALFSVTLVSMILFVPIVEELLFRGCLQTWLRGHFSRNGSIFLSSLVFALFHFAYSQGISNMVFVVGLFALSCFLGFIYERQRSLWAPIGLHSFFNAISVLVVVFS
ncbi:MAG: lysostaphin resistance A-like protein [Waddliaceae bacterium]